MNFDIFKDPKKCFSIVLFIQDIDVEELKQDIEQLGKQRNVQLVVQPCPYEGIEFLYRVGHQLIAHETSVDVRVFWQAIALKANAPENIQKQVSEHHHQYLCAILEQDATKVKREGKVLESLAEYYAK